MSDPNQTKRGVGLIYNVVETVVLCFSVGLGVWGSTRIIAHERELGVVEAKVEANSSTLDKIQASGSSSLSAHVKEDDTRVSDMKVRLDKLEAAVIALQSAPGELKAINAQLQGLKEGQIRIERCLEEHMKEKKP